MQATDGDEHLGIGVAGHGTVGTAAELLGEKEAAIAREDADAAGTRALGLAKCGDLVQARPVLVLEHNAARQPANDLADDVGRDLHPRREREVLQYEGDVAERLGRGLEIVDDLRIGANGAGWRHHHARRARLHRDVREFLHGCEARGADADHDRDATVDVAADRFDERAAFTAAELRRFTHHAEHGDAGHAMRQVKLHQAPDAAEIDGAVVRERRDRNDENAACGRIELDQGILRSDRRMFP